MRVYVPITLSRLQEVVVSGGVGPLPVLAHAVTGSLKEEYAEGAEEEWEYAAMTAAAQDSLGLLTEDDPPRRVVIAVDVASVVPVDRAEPSLVELDEVVPVRAIAAVHVDAADAGEDVAAAREAWAAAEAGDPDAAEVVDRCLDHELGWFATQEIGELLEG
ncbi:MAG TPA: hypothetical protein VFG63_15360 [Nocardioidaceae bacterium]|nr:hypothetical protein [Nocardioidaceae bacterium]